ncbi:MAG: diguanylate cyclase, partial [Candidatus Omnitrophota bacterium]
MYETKNPGSRGRIAYDPSLLGPQHFDPFVEIYNRSFLIHFVPQIFKDAKDKGCKITIFMIDIDDFKQINDTYGHLAGDQVIKNVASILKKSIRDNDCVVRYAGDEFLIVLSETSLEISYKTSERIMEKVRTSSFIFNDQVIKQTISMGFSLFPTDANTLDGLIEYADQALYLAKKRGKNNCAYFKEVNVNQISTKVAMDSIPCRKFVGREKEMVIVHASINEVEASGGVKGVMVFGESGIGKSRILKEAAQYSFD